MRLISEFNSLLFPTRCFGCRELGFAICSQCRKLWNPHPYTSQISKLTVFSAVPYSVVAKNILLSAKEQNIKSADKLVLNAMKAALVELFRKYPSCALIPIPSRSSSNRRRGRDFINQMANSLAKQMGVGVLPLLEHQRKIRDQSKLGRLGRSENLAMALGVKSEFQGNYFGEQVVILDDLLTTGATINEANRALTKAGFKVQAAATACVALRRRE
jgi:predicted amidophosphoribosyltransferase